MQRFAQAIRAALAEECALSESEIRLETPRDASLGDLAFPCFVLGKERRQAPPTIAAELAGRLAERPDLADVRCQASGPYVNFTIERARLAQAVLETIERLGAAYGRSAAGEGRTVVIDLSSPNIAKPMSVGHLRSTVIGAAIQRLYDTLGYRTVGINHIGDWGSQFGKLVAAVERWGDSAELERDPIRALVALYVRFHEEEEHDPELAERAREAFRELESGVEGSVRATWRRLTDLSLAEFEKTYRRLGVRFDEVRGESFYEPLLEETVQRIVDAGVTEVSEGALIVPLGEAMPPCLLRKTDGTTLYATRDLAALFHRFERYAFERCLYVVGSDQRLHFRQLRAVLERMGLEWASRVEHVDFGMMRLPEGKMSTRKGRVVYLDEVLDRAVEEAAAIVAEKNPELAGRREVAEQVGIGAVVFNDLKRERRKDVEFDWKEVLSFEGETGPYVQYTHARLASILRKAAASAQGADAPDWSALGEVGPILVRLGRYPEVIASAAEHAEPSELASWAAGLCREVNAWYVGHRVLDQPGPVTAARLACVRSCNTLIASALAILGLAAPEEM